MFYVFHPLPLSKLAARPHLELWYETGTTNTVTETLKCNRKSPWVRGNVKPGYGDMSNYRDVYYILHNIQYT